VRFYFYTKLRTMKKNIFFLLFIIPYCLFTACNSATPENYFDRAVLSCNMMHGFASEGLKRELDNPSVKLVEGTKDQTTPMKRKEIIDSRTQYLESNLEKIKALKETDDTKNMLQASIALYEYVLPVYKNEYQQLAKLNDDGASKEQVEGLEKSIEEKYFPAFETLFNKLTAEAKTYATKNKIQVNWDVRTSPQ
jgi:hypothetical protein